MAYRPLKLATDIKARVGSIYRLLLSNSSLIAMTIIFNAFAIIVGISLNFSMTLLPLLAQAIWFFMVWNVIAIFVYLVRSGNSADLDH